MAIRRLRVRNFKSFREVEVQLSPLTALVGANASGRSNFVQLFRFLRDIARLGLEKRNPTATCIPIWRNGW